MNAHPSIYDTVTRTILDELARGVAPWVKPWTTGAPAEWPYNLVSQRQYTGVNILLLWLSALEHGFRAAGWLTYGQAAQLGGHIKRGAKGAHIVYASTYRKMVVDPKTGQEEEKERPFLKGYCVFNLEQTEGLPERLYRAVAPKPLPEVIEQAETFLSRIGARVRHGGDRAYYQPAGDFIQLPDPATFESPPHYYATSLHEHAHWSGHETRLHRDLSGRFGTEAYAAEELVAELSAAFLSAHLGLEGRLRHAEYIGSWIKLLADDKKAIFTAAAKATEAAEYLRAFTEGEKKPEEPAEREAEAVS